MLISKIKVRQSLSLKVLLTNLAFAIFIAIFIGVLIHDRVSSTVINEKISISKIETANALNLAQGHFNIARFQDDKGLRKVVQDFITNSREDGSLSGRETVILSINKDAKATLNDVDIIKLLLGSLIRAVEILKI